VTHRCPSGKFRQSGTNLEQFAARKPDIAKIFGDISAIAKAFNCQSVMETCALGLSDLDEDAFLLMVIGEFSRGKSTLINALLGARVLPVGAQPVTTMLNRGCYGEGIGSLR
jgi:ribosome biogenesis GTPase A